MHHSSFNQGLSSFFLMFDGLLNKTPHPLSVTRQPYPLIISNSSAHSPGASLQHKAINFASSSPLNLRRLNRGVNFFSNTFSNPPFAYFSRTLWTVFILTLRLSAISSSVNFSNVSSAFSNIFASLCLFTVSFPFFMSRVRISHPFPLISPHIFSS